MGNIWLVVFLPCLALPTVTPVKSSSLELGLSYFDFALMRELDFSSNFDKFMSMPWAMPCTADYDEIKQSIETDSNPEKEFASFSPQTESVVENRPTGRVTESDLPLHSTMAHVISTEFQINQLPHISFSRHAFPVVPHTFSPISGVPTTSSSPVTGEQIITKTGSKRARSDGLEEHQGPNSKKHDYPVHSKYYHNRSAFHESYKLVDFKPLTTIGHIALEAIASLKESNGRNLIDIDIQKQGGQKMVLLDRPNSSMNNFYQLAFIMTNSHNSLSGNSKASNENIITPSSNENVITPSSNENVITPSQGQRRNAMPAVVGRFTSILRKFKQPINPKIKFYTDLCSNHRNEKEKLLLKLRERYSKDKPQLKSNVIRCGPMMATMPVYLFYVDMINIMIPEGGVIDENLINDHRNVAIANFLEFTGKLLLKESTWINTFTKQEEELSLLKHNIPYIQKNRMLGEKANTFTWRAIHYWFISSRRELLVDEKSLDVGPDLFFRIFFRKLLESWIRTC